MSDRNEDAGPGIGKKFKENMVDKLLDEVEEKPMSKETKMILKEIMTKKDLLESIRKNN